jgi:hypothetical protein
MKKMRDNSNCFVDKSMSMFDLKDEIIEGNRFLFMPLVENNGSFSVC